MSNEELEKACARSFRAKVAAQVLAGYCANPNESSVSAEKLAAYAVQQADFLIAELDKTHDHPD